MLPTTHSSVGQPIRALPPVMPTTIYEHTNARVSGKVEWLVRGVTGMSNHPERQLINGNLEKRTNPVKSGLFQPVP